MQERSGVAHSCLSTLDSTHKEYWYPIPIHFCQHLSNLDYDEYEFCHQTDKVVCNTCTVRMQGCRDCRLHGAVPYAKCRISLATIVVGMLGKKFHC